MTDVRIDRILFATDFSPHSNRARSYASALARSLRASVVVLHVIETVYALEEDAELKEWFENLQNELRRDLDREVGLFHNEGIPADGSLAVGSPWETVIGQAHRSGADLIVVGSQGQSGRKQRHLLGTTSHKVALASDIPVLIVTEESE